MKNKKINKIIGTICSAMILLFASCTLGFNETESKNNSTYITLKNSNIMRSALPDISELQFEDLSNFTLSGTFASDTSKNFTKNYATSSDLLAAKIPVTEGIWTFALQAKKSETIFKDSISKTIVAGENTLKFNLALFGLGSGNSTSGAISIAINYDVTSTDVMPVVKANLYSVDGETKTLLTGAEYSKTLDFIQNEETKSSCYQINSINAGTYELKIDFYPTAESSTLLHTRKLLINVADSFTSVGSVNIRDFNDTTYDINYNLNGGTFNDVAVYPENFSYKEGLNSFVDAKRAGYDFAGWFTDAAFSTPITSIASGVTTEQAVYAKWTPKSDTPYTIKIYVQNTDDDNYTEYESFSATGTTEQQTTLPEKTYEHFTRVESKDEPVEIKGDGTSVAKMYYDRNVYTVTFDSNGGSAVQSKAARYGAKITKPESDPTRDTYNFKGWKIKNADFDFENTVVENNVTLSAFWAKVLTSENESWEYVKSCSFPGTYAIDFEELTYVKAYNSFVQHENLRKKGVYFELDFSKVDFDPDNFGGSFYEYCNFDQTNITKVVFPEFSKPLYISQLFANCEYLTSVTLPKWHEYLRSSFWNCEALQSITIPEDVTDIGYSFWGCKSLTSVTIPKNVTNMEESFRYCTSLTSVTIPKNVTNLAFAFIDCSSLTSVIFEEGCIIEKSSNFCQNCNNIQVLDTSHRFEILGENFASGVQYVIVDSTVKRIETYALYEVGQIKFEHLKWLDTTDNTEIVFDPENYAENAKKLNRDHCYIKIED